MLRRKEVGDKVEDITGASAFPRMNAAHDEDSGLLPDSYTVQFPSVKGLFRGVEELDLV
jgi:hypothetical protein